MELKWNGDNGEITLDGKVVKDIPEEVKNAIDFFKENGVETIKADLSESKFIFYRNGVMDHIPIEQHPGPGRKAREVIKNYLEELR
ncbi:MAG: hypothetical protein V1819_02120 [bacterium]